MNPNNCKGAKLDVNKVEKIPLGEFNFSKRFLETVIHLIQK